jgi:hypothetical protein
MKKFFAVLLTSVFVIVLFHGVAYADSGPLGVTAKAGTLGLGVEGNYSIGSYLKIRAGANTYSYDDDGKEDDIDYEFNVDLLTFSALLDWHVFGGAFRLSGGALLNQNEVDMKAELAATFQIGDTTYSLADVGNLTGEIDFNDVAPYAGIGWDFSLGGEGALKLVCDIGVMFQGSPTVDLKANGLLATDSTFLGDLAKEESKLEDEIDEYEYYPVISVGIAYMF